MIEEEALTDTGDEARFDCDFKFGEYEDPYLQVFVTIGDDLHKNLVWVLAGNFLGYELHGQIQRSSTSQDQKLGKRGYTLGL